MNTRLLSLSGAQRGLLIKFFFFIYVCCIHYIAPIANCCVHCSFGHYVKMSMKLSNILTNG